MYIVESHPEELCSEVLKILQSPIGEDLWDGRMPLQPLQKQSFVIQKGAFEDKRCSRLLERYGLSGSYLSSFVHPSLKRATRRIR